MPRHVRWIIAFAIAGVALFSASPAFAHGFTSTAYVTVTRGGEGHVRTTLELEYDLLIVSTADQQNDDSLFRDGTAAFDAGDASAQAAALDKHREAVLAYVTGHFSAVSCTATQMGNATMGRQEGVPYATLILDWDCPAAGNGHTLRSSLFPDAEGYVKGTKTIITYEIDGHSGSAALDSQQPAFSTAQTWYERFWEFFRLGAEHLLTGIDHILFLLALIVGSRRLRDIVLAATSFTLAHSVTFMLAALGLVDVPAAVVEPIIALSIAVVAAWSLWRLRRDGDSFDPSGAGRLAVVFCFGLVHGLGFAGALGIDEAFSWTLLWSLLVFNVGIEVVQLSLIALTFPLLIVLRRRSARAGRWVTGGISAGVTVMGLIWFVQRLI
jgi:hydrogenase/urease accessory protein HupE